MPARPLERTAPICPRFAMLIHPKRKTDRLYFPFMADLTNAKLSRTYVKVSRGQVLS